MILPAIAMRASPAGIPRESGDDPDMMLAVIEARMYSPRERG